MIDLIDLISQILALVSVVLEIVAHVQQQRSLPPATGDKILRHVTLAVEDGAAMPHEQTETGQTPALAAQHQDSTGLS